jgi:hypothetical protein
MQLTPRVQKTRHRIKIVALKWTLLAIVSIGNEKRKWGELKCSRHIRSRWQNILTKLLGITGQARNASTPLETWKCLIKSEILDDIFQHIIQYILIQPNFNRAQTKLRQKFFISLLCLAGAFWDDLQSREGFRIADRFGIETFRLVMNQ